MVAIGVSDGIKCGSTAVGLAIFDLTFFGCENHVFAITSPESSPMRHQTWLAHVLDVLPYVVAVTA